jgi:hypothetical protein
MSRPVLSSSSAMVHVLLTQLAQVTPEVAVAVAADGESAAERAPAFAAWAVRAGELIAPRPDVAAWDVTGMKNTRSIAAVASPRHREIRRIASHLPGGISS